MSAVQLASAAASRRGRGGARGDAGRSPFVLGLGDGPRLLSPHREGARRALNVAVALLGLALTAPLMAVIAALVALTSPGGVLFRQTRVGLDRRHRIGTGGRRRRVTNLGGRLFTMYKFRTMRSTPRAVAAWAGEQERLITPVGRVLRKLRLDELPQLLNVLKGDMNVVGPRPEQPAIFEQLSCELETYPRRQRVRPGITGWAQINLPYDRSVDDVRQKLAYDLQYIWRQSLREDLRIMARTVPVMLYGQGAQ